MLLGSVLWAFAMAASALISISSLDWETGEKVRQVAMVFALGGALSFPAGLFAARFMALGRSRETAIAAAFLGFGLTTVAITGLVFAFDYRAYYAEWHSDVGSYVWFLQFTYTTLGALYQFAVLGLRLLFPVGFLALLAVSVWFARLPR